MLAIAYINNMGGTVSPTLNRLNKEFWLHMVHGERHNSTGPTPCGGTELHCRCGIQNNEKQIRLAINLELGPLKGPFLTGVTVILDIPPFWHPIEGK